MNAKEVRDKLRQKSRLTQRRANGALLIGATYDADGAVKLDAALSGWHRSAAKTIFNDTCRLPESLTGVLYAMYRNLNMRNDDDA